MQEDMKYIIARIWERAIEVKEEWKEKPFDDFENGRHLAYYEVLDMIKSELDAHGYNLAEFGLDVNLEKELF